MSNPTGWYIQPDGQPRYWDGNRWIDPSVPGSRPVMPPAVARKKWFRRHPFLAATGAVLLLGVTLSLAGGLTRPGPVAKAPAPGVDGAGRASAPMNGPRGERAFVKAIVVGRAGYMATDNELKQRLILEARDRAVCAAVPDRKISDWVGRIDILDTTGQGKAVLEVVVGDRAKVSTRDNAFSDFSDDTLISVDSPMYATLAELGNGDLVRFSGTFIEDHGSCLHERSATSNGQLKTPNFIFQFSDVVPI